MAKSFLPDLVEECWQIRAFDEAGQQWSEKHYLGGYTSFASIPELHKMSSTFMELEKAIDKHVHSFAEHLEFELGSGTLRMNDFWLNIMPAQTVHSGHIHPLSVISGTFYVQTPKNSAAIKFEDPRLGRFMAAPPKREDCSRRNKQFVSIKAKAGQLVLFESWLRHEVPPSTNESERISVSFNYDWC